MEAKAQRADALSKERIVAAAIDILDADGESALTFRALTNRLATGSGAIYWHVANKGDLLAATTGAVIADVTTDVAADASPRQAIRAIALGMFDTITAHPWVGAQLSRAPWQFATVQLFESIGTRLEALGVPERSQFHAASALLSYILGVAAQNAVNARTAGTDRLEFLADVVDAWTQHDPVEYPFIHRIAAQMRDHDDREQYLAGIDLILAGLDYSEVPTVKG